MMRGGCVRTRGDEVARENITQKEKKKRETIDALSCSSSSHLSVLSLSSSSSSHTPLSSPLSSILLRLPSTAVCRADRGEKEREREREAGKEMMEKAREGRWRRGMKE